MRSQVTNGLANKAMWIHLKYPATALSAVSDTGVCAKGRGDLHICIEYNSIFDRVSNIMAMFEKVKSL